VPAANKEMLIKMPLHSLSSLHGTATHTDYIGCVSESYTMKTNRRVVTAYWKIQQLSKQTRSSQCVRQVSAKAAYPYTA
jgi:hypothetical protein